ncbi:TLDc domain-containing protein [Entamoeba marina]
MEDITENKVFEQFMNTTPDVMLFLKNVVNEVTGEGVKEINVNNEEKIEGNDEEILLKWNNKVKTLKEQIKKKDSRIEKEKLSLKKLFELCECLKQVINKEEAEVNELKKSANAEIEKIVNKENEILKKELMQRKKLYDEKKKELTQLKIFKNSSPTNVLKKTYSTSSPQILSPILPSTPPEKAHENGISYINQSADHLRQWSNKKKYTVIYDWEFDDGTSNDILVNKVMNKRNLYFICVDYEKNVYGGYVSEEILKTDSWTKDPNAFVFTLARNGKITPKKFGIKKKSVNNAFWIHSNDYYLFQFAYDIVVNKKGNERSYCQQECFDYGGTIKALTEKQGWEESHRFQVKQVVILQME